MELGKYVVYYESIKRDLYRCDERLKTKTEESTRLVDTELVVEHPKDIGEVNRREVCQCER